MTGLLSFCLCLLVLTGLAVETPPRAFAFRPFLPPPGNTGLLSVTTDSSRTSCQCSHTACSLLCQVAFAQQEASRAPGWGFALLFRSVYGLLFNASCLKWAGLRCSEVPVAGLLRLPLLWSLLTLVGRTTPPTLVPGSGASFTSCAHVS